MDGKKYNSMMGEGGGVVGTRNVEGTGVVVCVVCWRCLKHRHVEYSFDFPPVRFHAFVCQQTAHETDFL